MNKIFAKLKAYNEFRVYIELIIFIISIIFIRLYMIELMTINLVDEFWFKVFRGLLYLTFVSMGVSYFFQKYDRLFIFFMRFAYIIVILVTAILGTNTSYAYEQRNVKADVVEVDKDKGSRLNNVVINVSGKELVWKDHKEVQECDLNIGDVMLVTLAKGIFGIWFVKDINC
ncbi:hypothetical protein RCC89_19495 [Cytophagaceae bacterium ABcell3]|nr:hypothetical protein RCC89_19495 [Cytophagaceae bacterium ABcell3]